MNPEGKSQVNYCGSAVWNGLNRNWKSIGEMFTKENVFSLSWLKFRCVAAYISHVVKSQSSVTNS